MNFIPFLVVLFCVAGCSSFECPGLKSQSVLADTSFSSVTYCQTAPDGKTNTYCHIDNGNRNTSTTSRYVLDVIAIVSVAALTGGTGAPVAVAVGAGGAAGAGTDIVQQGISAVESWVKGKL